MHSAFFPLHHFSTDLTYSSQITVNMIKPSVTVFKKSISLIVWSGEAPAGPEQQQSTSIQDQNKQVKAKKEAVEP